MHSPLQLVLESIASFNSIFLDALARTARERPDQFPLPPALWGSFSRLSAADCLQGGAVSVCLAEAHFANAALWQRPAEGTPKLPSTAPREFWISSEDRVMLAHSLLLVAWHGAHTLPAFTRILFGMSDPVNRAFQATSFTRLYSLAQNRATWVHPRWPDRSDVWQNLVDPQVRDREAMPSPTLRLLQACAADSTAMAATALGGDVRENDLEHAALGRSTSTDPRASARIVRKSR